MPQFNYQDNSSPAYSQWYSWTPSTSSSLTITFPSSVAIASLYIPNESLPVTVVANGQTLYTSAVGTQAEVIPLPIGTNSVTLTTSSSSPALNVYATTNKLDPFVITSPIGTFLGQVDWAQSALDGNTEAGNSGIAVSDDAYYIVFVTAANGRGPFAVPGGITYFTEVSNGTTTGQIWVCNAATIVTVLEITEIQDNFDGFVIVEVFNTNGVGTFTSGVAAGGSITIPASNNLTIAMAFGHYAHDWLADSESSAWTTIAALTIPFISFWTAVSMPTDTHLGFTIFPSDCTIMAVTLEIG